MNDIWIDTDLGLDDCFAILYAHHHPEINIKGISLAAGNVPLNQVIINMNYRCFLKNLKK